MSELRMQKRLLPTWLLAHLLTMYRKLSSGGVAASKSARSSALISRPTSLFSLQNLARMLKREVSHDYLLAATRLQFDLLKMQLALQPAPPK